MSGWGLGWLLVVVAAASVTTGVKGQGSGLGTTLASGLSSKASLTSSTASAAVPRRDTRPLTPDPWPLTPNVPATRKSRQRSRARSQERISDQAIPKSRFLGFPDTANRIDRDRLHPELSVIPRGARCSFQRSSLNVQWSCILASLHPKTDLQSRGRCSPCPSRHPRFGCGYAALCLRGESFRMGSHVLPRVDAQNLAGDAP